MQPERKLSAEDAAFIRKQMQISIDKGEMSALRFEAFSRRVGDAETGEPKSLEFANALLQGIRDELQRESNILRPATPFHDDSALAAKTLSDRERGISENPRYQAFLDTLEDPSTLTSNIPFMCWVQNRLAEAKALKLASTDDGFGNYIRGYADTHLSERVRQQRLGVKAKSNEVETAICHDTEAPAG